MQKYNFFLILPFFSYENNIISPFCFFFNISWVMKQHFFPQTAAVKMSVDFRRTDLLMTQHGLYRPQPGPALQQVRGKTVTERVRRYLFLDAGCQGIVLDENKEGNSRERTSATHGQEHNVLKTLHRLHLPPYGEPILQLLHRTPRNGHQTLLTSLSENADVTFFRNRSVNESAHSSEMRKPQL